MQVLLQDPEEGPGTFDDDKDNQGRRTFDDEKETSEDDNDDNNGHRFRGACPSCQQ